MTSPLQDYPTTRRRRSRLGRVLPRTFGGWALLLLGLLLLAGLTAYLLARSTPAWYVLLDPTDQQVIDQAERAQRKLYLDLNNTLQAVPLGKHEWTITQDEINSLIAVHFADANAATTGGAAPPAVSGPIVVFTPGKITLAARTPKAPGGTPNGGVVSVVFSVRSTQAVDGSPAGVIHIDGLWVGNLPVPRSFAQDRVQATLPQLIPAIERALSLRLGARRSDTVKHDVEDTSRLIAAGEPFPLEFKFDRRMVVIKEIRVDDGSLTITFVPPTRAAAQSRPGTP
jgi:hypothetical protein